MKVWKIVLEFPTVSNANRYIDLLFCYSHCSNGGGGGGEGASRF